MANSKLYPTLSPASTQARTTTGANAAHCRSGGHPPVDLIPAGAGAAPMSALAGSAPRPTVAPTPYHCECGAPDPYIGKRPVKKGGNNCPLCRAAERQIYQAQMSAYRAIANAAYEPGVCGDEKRAIIARATAVSSRAWREAQIAFGIDLGREDRLALATALTDAGHELINAGQDMALAADRQVAA